MSPLVNEAAWITSAKSKPLQVGPAPAPMPEEHEIVIKVAYASVNPVDWKVGFLPRVYKNIILERTTLNSVTVARESRVAVELSFYSRNRCRRHYCSTRLQCHQVQNRPKGHCVSLLRRIQARFWANGYHFLIILQVTAIVWCPGKHLTPHFSCTAPVVKSWFLRCQILCLWLTLLSSQSQSPRLLVPFLFNSRHLCPC